MMRLTIASAFLLLAFSAGTAVITAENGDPTEEAPAGGNTGEEDQPADRLYPAEDLDDFHLFIDYSNIDLSTPLAGLIRCVVLATVVLTFLLAALLVARRLAGALTTPLDAEALLLTAALLAATAAGFAINSATPAVLTAALVSRATRSITATTTRCAETVSGSGGAVTRPPAITTTPAAALHVLTAVIMSPP